jgi:glycosyltransferase involved in cell wall biosynthesis
MIIRVLRMRTIAAIPCFNEELTIGSLLLKTRSYVDDVLVVNDGSQDSTAKVATLAGARVISHDQNRGKGRAVLTAVDFALSQEYEVLVLMDGDGQHNPDEIPILLDGMKKGEADCVIGSRFLGSASDIPQHRVMGQRILNKLTNIAARKSTTDSQSGFRALNRRAMEALGTESEGYNIESDMIRRFSEQGLRISEVPISVRYKVPNGNKQNAITHGLGVFSHIVSLIGYRRPLISFSIPGLVMTITGLLLAFHSYSLYQEWGSFPYAYAFVSVVVFTLGVVMILVGLILNFLVLITKSMR